MVTGDYSQRPVDGRLFFALDSARALQPNDEFVVEFSIDLVGVSANGRQFVNEIRTHLQSHCRYTHQISLTRKPMPSRSPGAIATALHRHGATRSSGYYRHYDTTACGIAPDDGITFDQLLLVSGTAEADSTVTLQFNQVDVGTASTGGMPGFGRQSANAICRRRVISAPEQPMKRAILVLEQRSGSANRHHATVWISRAVSYQ